MIPRQETTIIRPTETFHPSNGGLIKGRGTSTIAAAAMAKARNDWSNTITRIPTERVLANTIYTTPTLKARKAAAKPRKAKK